jgi:hypothetical protein
MILTGVCDFSYVTSPQWDLNVGTGERIFRSPDIPFDPPFVAPPNVALALSGIDSDQATNLRVEVYPHDVEAGEFNIVVKTWDETVLYGVWITWIAYD